MQLKSFILAAGVFALSACSYIPGHTYVQNRDAAYLKAQSAPALRIPPGTQTHGFGNSYPIPPATGQQPAVSIVPPGLK